MAGKRSHNGIDSVVEKCRPAASPKIDRAGNSGSMRLRQSNGLVGVPRQAGWPCCQFVTSLLLAEQPPGGNLQATRKGLNLVIHDVTGLIFEPRDSSLIHDHAPGGQSPRQIVLRNARTQLEARFAHPFADDVPMRSLNCLFHAMRTSHGKVSKDRLVVMWTTHNTWNFPLTPERCGKYKRNESYGTPHGNRLEAQTYPRKSPCSPAPTRFLPRRKKTPSITLSHDGQV